MEGEEAGDFGDTLEPEKEKSSLKVEKKLPALAAHGP
jgi:hypothetical protein